MSSISQTIMCFCLVCFVAFGSFEFGREFSKTEGFNQGHIVGYNAACREIASSRGIIQETFTSSTE